MGPAMSLAPAEVCIVGRVTFGSGIGAITYAMCELLARSFPICVLPTEPELRCGLAVSLPNGRLVPVVREPQAIKVWIFCDVLWNGTYDRNYLLVPKLGLRVAYIVFDSDELPPEWVNILNHRFDVVMVTSPHLGRVAHASGVEIPIASLPVALDIESLLSRPFKTTDSARIRFLSIAAFHPRKETETLIRAFMAAFGNTSDVELVLHSNLAFGDYADRLERFIREQAVQNVHISRVALSDHEKNQLVEGCDVFVNLSRGEGYSIGPREALALGKPLVLSAVGGHLDLEGVPGVYLIRSKRSLAARYPEIDNRIFGRQSAVEMGDAATALREAVDLIRSGRHLVTLHERRSYAANFSFSRLSASYAEIINSDIRAFRRAAPVGRHVYLPQEFRDRVQKAIGPRANALGHTRNCVVQMHDGGFFSIFNAFFSHLVWNLMDKRCHHTLPDWDVRRLIERNGGTKFKSFCYGRPEEGNIWLQWFEPLFGLGAEEMNSCDFLYEHAAVPTAIWNEDREPLLTHVNAYRLYRWKGFPAWRRQYHAVWRDHVALRPALAAEIDVFARQNFEGRYMIAAHVRHPGHAQEQPGLVMAHAQTYIDRILSELGHRGIDPAGTGWGIFLATDQEGVVRQFEDAFRERVCYFSDVRRTTAAEEGAYDALSPEINIRDGQQLQHIVASSPDTWSSRMAWEVIRDALAMSHCRALLHVVSNISTAVSYMNPNVELLSMS
jgi:glycosyltransferase involved in cell wall biosynthesis